jgi:hypothetical protein
MLAVGLLVAVGVPALAPRHTALSAVLVEQTDRVGAPPADAARIVAELLRSEPILTHVSGRLGLSVPGAAATRSWSILGFQLPSALGATAGPEALLDRLRRKIRVNDRGGGVVVLAVDDADPTTAMQLNQALVEALSAVLAGDALEGAAPPAGLRATVLQAARRPSRAASVDPIRFVLLGSALAVGIGLAGMLVAEAVSLGFESGADARVATGLDVIGSLPQLGDGFHWQRRRQWICRLGRAAFALLLAAAITAFFLIWERDAQHNQLSVASQPSAADRWVP